LIPILGWNSPSVQFEGPAVQAVRKSYLSWHPTSFAYTSSAPSAQPHDRVWISQMLGNAISAIVQMVDNLVYQFSLAPFKIK
jgi:hypothetical protein